MQRNFKFKTIMTLTNIISNLETRQLKRLYNSQKYYFYFDISVFNTGAVINPICTNKYKEISYRNWNGYDFICENDNLIHYLIESELLKRNALKLHYFRFVVPAHYEHKFTSYKQACKKAKQLKEPIYLIIYLYKNKYNEPYNEMIITFEETSETISAKQAILLEKTRKYFN